MDGCWLLSRDRAMGQSLLPRHALSTPQAEARGAWRVAMNRGIRLQTPATDSIPDTGYPRRGSWIFWHRSGLAVRSDACTGPGRVSMAAPRPAARFRALIKVKGRTFMSNVSKAGGDDHNNA